MRKMQDFVLKSKKTFVGLEDSKRTWKLCVRSDGQEVTFASMPTEYNVLFAIFEAGFRSVRSTVFAKLDSKDLDFMIN
jgi:hypothetical protein